MIEFEFINKDVVVRNGKKYLKIETAEIHQAVMLTNKEVEVIECMVENEINSDLDMTTMTKGKEHKFWKNEVLFLKDLKEKLKADREVLEENEYNLKMIENGKRRKD
ncbi:MAG TPA: hypothetical protein VGB37_15495 [Candidatus Lokiarchaeia archaeon]